MIGAMTAIIPITTPVATSSSHTRLGERKMVSTKAMTSMNGAYRIRRTPYSTAQLTLSMSEERRVSRSPVRMRS